jgi:tRNA(Ile)-lysidine synthase
LNCLLDLAPEYGLEVLAVHFNHKLRGAESEEDQKFVEDLCCRLGVELRTGSGDIKEIATKKKGSLEELCRESRYDFLLSLMRERGFGKIALGHNLDDQAETVLMNVIRGTGIDGLKGIDPVRDCYIRPLIEVTRAEIMEFLDRRKIPFRIDSSNLENAFRRNSVRNSLIPEIRGKYNPSVTAALGRLAGIARMENRFLDKVAREALDRLQPRIKLDEFLRHDPAIQNRIIKMALEELSPVKGGISHEHVAAAMNIITGSNPGASINLPYRISVRREYDHVIIGREKRKDPEFQYMIKVPGILLLKETGMEFRFALLDRLPENMNSEWKAFMDYSSVVPPLVFRNFRPGDRIQPFGMDGHKKLQDVFTDRKIPRARRRAIPVLADAESVLWVPGVVMSERMRIAAKTGNVLSVEKI